MYTPSGVLWSPCLALGPTGSPPNATLYVLTTFPCSSNCSVRSFFNTTTRSACNSVVAEVCATPIPHNANPTNAVRFRIRMPAIIDRPNSAKCYADGVLLVDIHAPARREPMWRQPPRLSRLSLPRASAARRGGNARRLRACALIAIGAFLYFTAALPSSAATWAIHTQPTTLVNGGPILFQVKPPAKLESLTGTWLGHQLTFSYDSSHKTWFALAGVSIETPPGKYPLELTADRPATKTALTVTRTFAIARAHYPQIKVELTVEKKFTEPSPEQQAQAAEGVKIKQD